MASRRLPRRANSDPTFYCPRSFELLLETGLLPVFRPSAPIAFSLDDESSDSPTEAESESSSSTSSSHSSIPSDSLLEAQRSWSGLYLDPHPTGPVDIPLPNAQLLQSLADRPTVTSPVIHLSIGNFGAANGYNASGSESADIQSPRAESMEPIARPASVSPESQAGRPLRSMNRYNPFEYPSVNNLLRRINTAEPPPSYNQVPPQTSQLSTNGTVSAHLSASASVPRENPIASFESQALDGDLDDTSDNLEVGSETESPTNRLPPPLPESISNPGTDETTSLDDSYDTISLDGSDDTIIIRSDQYYRQHLIDARQRLERVVGRVLEPSRFARR